MSRETEFFQKYWPAAVKATQGTNVSPYILLGQIAQETGYGAKISGNNPLNITAGSKWTGPTMTRGDATKTDPNRQQKFRAYGSIDEAMADYVKLMQGNARYAGTLQGTTAERAAALGKSGYAEDTTYGQKVGDLAGRFEKMGGATGGAYASGPPAVNGIVGGVTPSDLPWGGQQPAPLVQGGGTLGGALQTALRYQGMNETANVQVLGQFMAEKGIPFTPNNVAWCARFVNAALAEQGLPTTGSNLARSFLQWGQGTDKPNQGDIAVFSRGDDPTKGHVGFYGGTVDRNGQTFIRVYGGNQGGKAKGGGEAGWTEIPASRLLGYRTAGGQSYGAAGSTGAGYVAGDNAQPVVEGIIGGVRPSDLPWGGPQAPQAPSTPDVTQTGSVAAPAPSRPYSVAPNSDAARMLSDPSRYGLSPEQAIEMRRQLAAGGPGGGTIGNIPAPSAPLPPPQPPGVLSAEGPAPAAPGAPPPSPFAQTIAGSPLPDWLAKHPDLDWTWRPPKPGDPPPAPPEDPIKALQRLDPNGQTYMAQQQQPSGTIASNPAPIIGEPPPGAQGTAGQLIDDFQKKRPLGLFQGGWT